MIVKALRKIEYLVRSTKICNLEAYREVQLESSGKYPARDNEFHLREAIDWIRRAQDANNDGGVARGYSIAWNPHFKGKGWQRSYPETTGYIIPTFFEAAEYLNEKDLFDRAVRMAEWETAVQMKSGAVRGGTVGEGEPVPSVFCTGQVIFGLVRAYEETGTNAFLEAAVRAGDYLLSVQDKDGRLLEDSRYNFAKQETTVYHTRVAWSLAMLGKATKRKEYMDAGERNIEYNLGYQTPAGWFSNNCIYDAARPLLHTICYAIRGILETGVLIGEEKFIKAAGVAADRLLAISEGCDVMPGRFDKDWNGAVNWSCLTGDAQLAIILLRFHQLTKDPGYLKGAQKLNAFVKTTQNCSSTNPGIRGGIKGSYPVGDGYGRFQILNWATKFFADALLLENMVREGREYEAYG